VDGSELVELVDVAVLDDLLLVVLTVELADEVLADMLDELLVVVVVVPEVWLVTGSVTSIALGTLTPTGEAVLP
jgi:hypothetical protein